MRHAHIIHLIQQAAANSSYAWCQFFGRGGQDDNFKTSQLRARAVRKVKI